MEELAQHILDLLMNSWEAGATEVEAVVEEDSERDLMIISVTDNGKGMEPELLAKALDPFTTTRSTRGVGLGLSLLQAMADSCNGSIKVESSPANGCSVTIELQRSHWDRLPLGDIPATISAFVCAAPYVRLKFRYVINGHGYLFDSAKVEKLIAPVPLNHPKVIQWIKESVKEELTQFV
ncbi:MAG: ATP-binding protein [Bacillota bacterium]